MGTSVAVLVAIAFAIGQASPPPGAPPKPGTPDKPPAQGTADTKPASKQLPFTIDAAVTPDQPEIVLRLDSDGTASFGVVRRGDEATAEFSLGVSDLRDAQGQPSAAVLAIDGVDTGSNVLHKLTAPDRLLRVHLRVSPPPTARVSGTLMLATGADTVTWQLHAQPAVTRPRPATLAVAPLTQPLRLTRPRIVTINSRLHRWWKTDSNDRTFSASVFDKSHTSPLQGVFVRVDQITKADGGFDVARDIDFTFNGKPADLLVPATDTLRDLPPGQPGIARGTVRGDLSAGEYNVTLRFGASNSVDDDAQKMTLTVWVKDALGLPLLVLIGAVLASFVATKVVEARRESFELKDRIARIDAPWLRRELAPSAAIWARANLSLANEVLNFSWVKVPDLVKQRVQAVETFLKTLQSIHDLDEAVSLSSPDRLVTRRARRQLARLLGRCAEPPLTPTVKAAIEAGLARLDPWGKPESLMTAYWSDLRAAIERLLSRIETQTVDIQDRHPRNAIVDLVKTLKRHLGGYAEGSAPNNAVDIERQYDALKLLWEHRHNASLRGQLVDEYRKNSVEPLYRIDDGHAWSRIKAAADQNTLRILRSPASPEAFEPFTLTVTTGVRELDSSFLFAEGIRFEWNIELKRRRLPHWWRSDKELRQTRALNPVAMQPAITQYSPWRGLVTARVVLRYEGETCAPTETLDVRVEKSTALRVLRSLYRTEVIPLVFALIVAVATGLSSLYAGNATFGSLGDYLALFLVGVGVDQVKNAAVREQAKKTMPEGGDSTPGDKKDKQETTPVKAGADKHPAGQD